MSITYEPWQAHDYNGSADADQHGRPIEMGAWYVTQIDPDAEYIIEGPYTEEEARHRARKLTARHMENAPPMREGSWQADGGPDSYWTAWWVFPAGVTDEHALSFAYFPTEVEPGQPFIRRPHLRRRGSRVLVTQTGGWNV